MDNYFVVERLDSPGVWDYVEFTDDENAVTQVEDGILYFSYTGGDGYTYMWPEGIWGMSTILSADEFDERHEVL